MGGATFTANRIKAERLCPSSASGFSVRENGLETGKSEEDLGVQFSKKGDRKTLRCCCG